MKESCQDNRTVSVRGLIDWAARARLCLERESLAFIVASGLDLVMTYLLLRYDNGDDHIWFDESNPIARYFLYSWGVKGLIYFKILTVTGVVLICQIIASRRLEVARRLLQFAALAAAFVSIYSGYLMMRHT